eukprot:scaffold126419_cov17-Tisochrysis_lutea.AAC.1
MVWSRKRCTYGPGTLLFSITAAEIRRPDLMLWPSSCPFCSSAAGGSCRPASKSDPVCMYLLSAVTPSIPAAPRICSACSAASVSSKRACRASSSCCCCFARGARF